MFESLRKSYEVMVLTKAKPAFETDVSKLKPEEISKLSKIPFLYSKNYPKSSQAKVKPELVPKHSLSVIEHMIDPKRKTRLRDFFATPTHYNQHMQQFEVSKVDAFNASLSPRVEEMQLVKKYKNLLYEEQSKTDFGLFEEPKFMYQPTFHNQKLNNLFEQYVDPVKHQRVSILKNQQTRITDIKVAIEPTFKNVAKPLSKPHTPKHLMKRKKAGNRRDPAIRIQNHCTSTQRSSQCIDIDTQILDSLVGPENPVPMEIQTSFVEELIKKDKEKIRFNTFNLARSSVSGVRTSFNKQRDLPDSRKTETSTNEDLYVVKQAPFITVRTNAKHSKKKSVSPNQRSLPLASKIIQIDHMHREPAGQKPRTPFSAAVNAQLLVKKHNQASRGSVSPPPPKKTSKSKFKVQLPLILCNKVTIQPKEK